jgi:plastocyanin
MLARLTLSTMFLAALASCGSSSNGNADAAAKKDSTVSPDATTGVETIACPATPDATMSNASGAFVATPGGGSAATITVGQIVQFTTTSEHDATPNTGVDPGVHVPFNQTSECKKFTMAGTFAFHCSIHGFMGTVVVN